jgi:hypothetical protein
MVNYTKHLEIGTKTLKAENAIRNLVGKSEDEGCAN